MHVVLRKHCVGSQHESQREDEHGEHQPPMLKMMSSVLRFIVLLLSIRPFNLFGTVQGRVVRGKGPRSAQDSGALPASRAGGASMRDRAVDAIVATEREQDHWPCPAPALDPHTQIHDRRRGARAAG